jgi:hypothetical protein
MTKPRRYINDPATRHFFETLDGLTWWESCIGVVIGVLVLIALGIARLFGWRPE